MTTIRRVEIFISAPAAASCKLRRKTATFTFSRTEPHNMLLADAAETFVPVVGILVLFGLPITYAIISRYLAHQERMEMLRRGMIPPADPKWAKRAAKAGWYASQYMGTPGPQPNAPYTIPYDPYGQARADRYLRKGITLAMIGLALLIGLSFIDNLAGQPGPWLLGGLIPLFAGIAQIIIALMSGARLGPGLALGCD